MFKELLKNCWTLAKVHLIPWLAACQVRWRNPFDIVIFIFWLLMIKSSFHVTRPWNNRIWQALLHKLGFLPGHQCQPASHKCFMWCWYGNHRISTMTPCESWITMAVFQACVTLAAVQHPEVWISSKKQKNKNQIWAYWERYPTVLHRYRLTAKRYHTNGFLCVRYALCFIRFGSRCALVAPTQLEDAGGWLALCWHTKRARGVSNTGLKEDGSSAADPGF